MSIERHEYSEINDLLKSLRRSRLLNSRGVIQRTFKVHQSSITIQEESERSLRSSVSEIDECLSFFMGADEMKPVFKGKTVLDIDAGCGLIGIIAAQLGGKLIFTNPPELVPILKSNIATNCADAEHEIKEFAWGNDASQLCPHFHDFVLCGSHILQNREEGSLDTIIKDLVEVSGNGTMLILGYKVPQHAPEIETEFREVFCKYFDLRNGRQVIYEMPDGDVVIMYVRRKPYSSFFEKFSFCPHRA